MSKQTKRLHRQRHRITHRQRHRITHRRKPITHRRKPITHRRRKHPEFMTLSRNRGRGQSQSQGQSQRVILFAIPEEKKSFKIILDNNNDKQFGNIIPGLREM